MSGASRRHVLIATNFSSDLRQALRSRPCKVYSADLRVGVSGTGLYTYPDIVVTCGQEIFHDEQFDTLLNLDSEISLKTPRQASDKNGGWTKRVGTFASREKRLRCYRMSG